MLYDLLNSNHKSKLTFASACATIWRAVDTECKPESGAAMHTGWRPEGAAATCALRDPTLSPSVTALHALAGTEGAGCDGGPCCLEVVV